VSITDQLLAALSLYGLPVLFGVLVIGCAGIPLPGSLMLVAAGSFTQFGEMKLWQVITVASAASVLGDQIGYGLGRWGGRLAERFSRRLGGEEKLKRAEEFAKRWGGTGIFFSRWLVTPLGPWLNLTSGMAAYSWPRFLLWDVLGEVTWVVLYVMLGKFFSDRVQALAEILGSLAWVIAGLVLTVILGWQLAKYFRPARPARTNSTSRVKSEAA
jgi:membrane protein DedA with SNARE-associated domain